MRAAFASSVSAEALIAAGAQQQLCAAAAASAMRLLAIAGIVAAARGTGNAEVVNEAVAARVQQVDFEWFVANPDRHYHVRAPLPDESREPMAGGRLPYTLAIMDPTNTTVIAVPIHARQMPPDDEFFLRKLWQVICARAKAMPEPGMMFFDEPSEAA
jgi:hypothetical protein